MRLHLITLLCALAVTAFAQKSSYKPSAPAPAPYRPPANNNYNYGSSNRSYTSPGSRSTTGVQPRSSSSINRSYVAPGSRSTTGVQPRGTAASTINSQRSQLSNSSTNKSNVVAFPSASQKQNVNDRLARLQTGSANQNTPKASNDNKLSDKFNKAAGKGSGGSGGGNGNNGGGGGAGGNGNTPGGGNGKLTAKQVDDASKHLAQVRDNNTFKAPSTKLAPGTKLGDKTLRDGKPMVVGNQFNSTASQKYSTAVTTPKPGGTAGGAVSVNRQTKGVVLPKDLKATKKPIPPVPNPPAPHPHPQQP